MSTRFRFRIWDSMLRTNIRRDREWLNIGEEMSHCNKGYYLAQKKYAVYDQYLRRGMIPSVPVNPTIQKPQGDSAKDRIAHKLPKRARRLREEKKEGIGTRRAADLHTPIATDTRVIEKWERGRDRRARERKVTLSRLQNRLRCCYLEARMLT
ncbi:hypothetical protein M407DRAFT_212109 [Tulasnella calospora MUT 4182]|uniref:Uncharacterized protein n=1 Tax=Tulasnella calospora MUT 4182 TaxID=1051891 RepID=A0A0C3LTP1_9AGAM|nr:hypothetical protein M407DRAFT_212109 [Tulasnella calospora MUT 4182]